MDRCDAILRSGDQCRNPRKTSLWCGTHPRGQCSWALKQWFEALIESQKLEMYQMMLELPAIDLHTLWNDRTIAGGNALERHKLLLHLMKKAAPEMMSYCTTWSTWQQYEKMWCKIYYLGKFGNL